MLTDTIGIEMKYPKFDSVVRVYESEKPADVFNMVKKSIAGIFDGDQYWQSEDQSDDDLDDFLNRLTKEQFDKIEKFFVSSPKIVQTIETDCPSCGHHNKSRIEGLQNFFV